MIALAAPVVALDRQFPFTLIVIGIAVLALTLTMLSLFVRIPEGVKRVIVFALLALALVAVGYAAEVDPTFFYLDPCKTAEKYSLIWWTNSCYWS